MRPFSILETPFQGDQVRLEYNPNAKLLDISTINAIGFGAASAVARYNASGAVANNRPVVNRNLY